MHWLRMPLPFALDHINLWVLEDGDGYAIIDQGGVDAMIRSKPEERRAFFQKMREGK